MQLNIYIAPFQDIYRGTLCAYMMLYVITKRIYYII